MAKHVNRICWASPKMFLQLNLTAYLDPAALGRYSTVLGNIFHITYPRLDNKTTADLAKAVVALEADIVKAALTYKASLGPAGLDLYVSATFYPWKA